MCFRSVCTRLEAGAIPRYTSPLRCSDSWRFYRFDQASLEPLVLGSKFKAILPFGPNRSSSPFALMAFARIYYFTFNAPAQLSDLCYHKYAIWDISTDIESLILLYKYTHSRNSQDNPIQLSNSYIDRLLWQQLNLPSFLNLKPLVAKIPLSFEAPTNKCSY